MTFPPSSASRPFSARARWMNGWMKWLNRMATGHCVQASIVLAGMLVGCQCQVPAHQQHGYLWKYGWTCICCTPPLRSTQHCTALHCTAPHAVLPMLVRRILKRLLPFLGPSLMPSHNSQRAQRKQSKAKQSKQPQNNGVGQFHPRNRPNPPTTQSPIPIPHGHPPGGRRFVPVSSFAFPAPKAAVQPGAAIGPCLVTWSPVRLRYCWGGGRVTGVIRGTEGGGASPLRKIGRRTTSRNEPAVYRRSQFGRSQKRGHFGWMAASTLPPRSTGFANTRATNSSSQ